MSASKLGRLNQIESELQALYEERTTIQNELSEERKAKNLERLRAWNVDEGSCLILFAKKPTGYHWHICKTIKVKEIDFENEYVDSIHCSYGEADYEYYARAEECRTPFAYLEELEKEFNIYMVDEVQITLLQQYMCNLQLDYKNYTTYENTFSKAATMTIKTPLK